MTIIQIIETPVDTIGSADRKGTSLISTPLSAAERQFVDYFGALGPRWGLPEAPCRLHALLYLNAAPIRLPEIAACLDLSEPEAVQSTEFLAEYGLLSGDRSNGWTTHGDPWDMLVASLEKRRERELPEALDTLNACRLAARNDTSVDRTTETQMQKLCDLVEDIAAIDAQAQRFSPRTLRRILGMGGRAARLMGGTPQRRR